MRPLELPLLADENVDPAVVSQLRSRGHDVRMAMEVGLGGATDREILRAAREAGRIIVTHDADFGTLAIRDGEPFLGVVYVRPDHVSPTVVLSMFERIAAVGIDVEPPFLIVVDRRGAVVRVRVRRPG